MRVLADYHHSDLFESYAMLFEDRWGWELYRPIGMEWFHEGYWQFEKKWHGDAVAKQYLEPWGDDLWLTEGLVLRTDRTHPGRTHKMLPLQVVRYFKPDIIIASVPDNEAGFYRLAQEVGAKYGVQVGNQNQMVSWELADFGMVSSTLDYVPTKPHVIYHQEFSLKDFRYEPPPRHNRVASFIQCLAQTPHAYAELVAYAERNPYLDWRVYGSYGNVAEDRYAAGNIGSTPGVAAAMRDTDVIWHTKEWSDGYGHVVHNAFAVGRPVIGRAGYYRDKLAGPLWDAGWDLGIHDLHETEAYLRRLSEEEDFHREVAEAANRRFHEVVNFDEDAGKLRAMFEAVL